MQFPPESFEQLRQIALMLRQGDIDLAIGKKILHALENMVADPQAVAQSNIVLLAKHTKTSPASMTRLAKLLGFQGFNQFQQLFKQKSNTTNHFYSNGVKKLLENKALANKAGTPNYDQKFLLKKQLAQTTVAIEQCIDSISSKSLNKASQLLAKKHRIFIFGYRQSSAIASILRYGLALLRPNVQMLVQADHGVAIALGQLKKDDLLVVISSAPYSNVTVKIAALAKQQQCQLIAITDSHLSPLNDSACTALHLPNSGDFYANSLVANCFFVEGLLSLTAIELGQSAINNLQQHEQLLTQLDISS